MNQRVALFSGIAGLALIGLGAWAYSRERRVLTGGGFGRSFGRGRIGQAPVVSTYSDGRMKTTMRASPDMPIEQRLATIQDLVHKSIQDPQMRKISLQATAHCPERDGLCEAKAIYDFIKGRVRYTGDIAPIRHPDGNVEGIDLFQSARRTLEFGGGDCLPLGTLLLTERYEFAPIESLVIGQRIWGRDGWTKVLDVWFKGVLPLDVVFMNNGSSFKATADHKVYVALCPRHPVRWESTGQSCSCSIVERSIERMRVEQLEPGMVLVQPESIAFGSGEMDPDRAFIEGLYIADGDSDRDSAFRIAGQDGCPKEAQKKEVAEICERLGIPTNWQRKYITVKDGEWTKRIQQMGLRAWNKHALSIDLNEHAAAALLRGIMADSGANTHGNGRTFTTTSRLLMLQARVLHRMFGRSCSERYIVDHGGLGERPIWRLGVRDEAASKAPKMLRVKAIERAVLDAPVYDISTEDHYVYLPEADVTVSNCDDHNILAATMLAHNGITPRMRVVKTRGAPDWEHIYAGALLPKGTGNKFVALDTTLPGNDNFGVEPDYHKKIDFDA